MHPEFNEIISWLSNNNIKFYLSSNFSVLPKNINKNGFKTCQGITISMPGFSQASYDKIHGFKFERILQNINKIKNIASATKFIVSYHIYQFNIQEIKEVQKYFKDLSIEIFSNFAYFNDYNMAQKYLQNKFTCEEWNSLSKDMTLHYVDRKSVV